MSRFYLFIILSIISIKSVSQDSDDCKLDFGTNLSGLADYTREIPFVDMMKTCRTWYTKSMDDPDYTWNTDLQDKLTYRVDGYPTHIPQSVDSVEYEQQVATIWAIISGWKTGEYTVLWDGNGTLDFYGSITNLQLTDKNRMTFNVPIAEDGAIEMIISKSDINDPIRNIRVLMPGTESTYLDEPFNQAWLDLLEPFGTLRFMDWGQTNNWGQPDPWTIGDGSLVDWSERSQVEHYTWAYEKGIPYEMMIALMNHTGKDGWVCVPHIASEDFNRKMAAFFRDNLDENRHLYVEYSNEIWNWIFGQANWVYKYGCEETGETWPEGTVKYIQNMLDYWTDEYKSDLDRITRVVGVFTAWQDVAERVAYNVNPSTYDAVSPTYYFSFTEEDGEELTALGANAIPADIAERARANMPQALEWIKGIEGIADSLDKKLVFYEGGQHFTPYPFGEECTYEQALLDIQRDTSMYNMYIEWFDMINSINDTDEDFLMMNFSFIAGRSAKYGSWGILESMYQDTSGLYAPKYAAILDYLNECQSAVSNNDIKTDARKISIFPNPTSNHLYVNHSFQLAEVTIYNAQHNKVIEKSCNVSCKIDISHLPVGIYFIDIINEEYLQRTSLKFFKL